MKNLYFIVLSALLMAFVGCENSRPSGGGGGGGGGSSSDGDSKKSTTVDVSRLTESKIDRMDDTKERCWHWVMTNGKETKEGYVWTTEQAIARELFQAYNMYLDEGVEIDCTYTPTKATDEDGCKSPEEGGAEDDKGDGDDPSGGDDDDDDGDDDDDDGGNPGGGGDDGGSTEHGALSGKFSISKSKKIQFSQGNLQFQASTGTWRFAEHQWSFVGNSSEGNVYQGGAKCDNESIADNYPGWIDLFGWGTSGWNSGAKEFYPWSRSALFEEYYVGNATWNDLAGAYAEADWGVFNAISNGGNSAGMWRTLTHDEWAYIMHGRSSASSLLGSGKVNDVCGIILLPDSWKGAPSGVTFHTFADNEDVEWVSDSYYVTPGNAYTYNSFTESQWQKMENAGAVFLPAAGLRSYTNVSQANWYGAYWSTTAHKSSEGLALLIGFQSEGLYVESVSDRSYGYSVRLVKDN